MARCDTQPAQMPADKMDASDESPIARARIMGQLGQEESIVKAARLVAGLGAAPDG